jgi:hypothetical protein
MPSRISAPGRGSSVRHATNTQLPSVPPVRHQFGHLERGLGFVVPSMPLGVRKQQVRLPLDLLVPCEEVSRIWVDVM